MKQWLEYKGFEMWLELTTSWSWVEKLERKVFVANNWQHKICIDTKHWWFVDLVELAKKKIDAWLKNSH